MEHTRILPAEGFSGAIPLPGTLPPAPAVMRILDQFNREEIGNTIEVLVALLDICDAPADPDEPDFRQLEADNLACRGDGMTGDPADGEASGDERDHSWPEWHSRGKRRVTAGGYEMAPIGAVFGFAASIGSEDDEDDDPAGQYDEDAYTGPLPRGDGPGCMISDNDFEHDGQEPEESGVIGHYGIDQTTGPSWPSAL